MIITEKGCVIHRNVQFQSENSGVSFWECLDCKVEFVQFEDLGSGA